MASDMFCIYVQVLSLGGELLSQAESLLRAGLHTSEVADGYLKAGDKVQIALKKTVHLGTVKAHQLTAILL